MTPIFNRDFQHPDDGWYMIEPKGEFPNEAAGVVQVIDDEAVRNMAARFAEDSKTPNWPGMLIDRDHLSHNQGDETRAYGWLTEVQPRSTGLFGKIRWSATGRQAVDGGDYRMFSTEYDLQDSVALNSEQAAAGLRRIRPIRLKGLALTNRPNNKGGCPITNREDTAAVGGQLKSREKGLARFLDVSGSKTPSDTQNASEGIVGSFQSPIMNITIEQTGLAAETAQAAATALTSLLTNRAGFVQLDNGKVVYVGPENDTTEDQKAATKGLSKSGKGKLVAKQKRQAAAARKKNKQKEDELYRRVSAKQR